MSRFLDASRCSPRRVLLPAGRSSRARRALGSGALASPLRAATLVLCVGAFAGCHGSSGGAPADAGGGAAEVGPEPDALQGPVHLEPDRSRMVEIPAGTFSMGHPDDKPGDYGQPWKENEVPVHPVTLPAYLMDRDEVTVADYAAFLGAAGGDLHRHPLQPLVRTATGYEPTTSMGTRPIAFVSWFDAATYCAWAGKRLPTEAEWERAARGPGNTTYPWGDNGPSCALAVGFTGANPCEHAPAPVGSRSPKGDSKEGLHDMAGNVGEWVWDLYAHYAPDAVTNPTGPATGRYRVIRGGGFREAPNELRALARWGGVPAGKSEGVGFRCALGK